MDLIALPVFSDNYIWLLHDGRQALVVDPGETQPVLDALARMHLQLQAILVTHHHRDHTDGVAALHGATGAAVYGPAHEDWAGRAATSAQGVEQGGVVSRLGLDLQVLDVPGHTTGHVAYFAAQAPLRSGPAPLLFCGDTLFSGGCGRLFEGTAAQMLHSLDALAALPGGTLVCCAHEYTLANLAFAQAVQPDNAALNAYTAHCRALRANGQPTLPAHLATELAINPFLRCRQPQVAQAVRQHAHLPAACDDAQVFGALRAWKNQF